MWVAPAKGSGCVRLSAMIYEGKDAWFVDAGGLTKIVCEQKPDKTKKVMSEDECCACDEAKYNVSPISRLEHSFHLHAEHFLFLFLRHFCRLLLQRPQKKLYRSWYLKESGRMKLTQRTTRLLFG